MENSQTDAPTDMESAPRHAAEHGASKPKHTRIPYRRLTGVIALIGALVCAVTLYSYETALRLAERHAPLIGAAMEIKLEATTAHLLFEETITNDRHEDIRTIRDHLAQADWYAQAMLEGDANAEAAYYPLKDAELRDHIQSVRGRLEQFNAVLERRWRARLGAGSTSSIDMDMNSVFQALISETDLVETRLQNQVAEATATFKLVQAGLGIFALVATAGLAYLFMSFAREQNRGLQKLQREIGQRIEAEETLRRQATTDTLTGLYNRRHINELIQHELLRAQRRDTPFSLILFDLDHFKDVNDKFGHDIGDQVLQKAAEAIAERLRELDAFARWGGEEFLILARETDLRGAHALAETCRTRLARTGIRDVGPITASFGVAQHQDGESLNDLVRRADRAMYAAKNGGRNRVMSADR